MKGYIIIILLGSFLTAIFSSMIQKGDKFQKQDKRIESFFKKNCGNCHSPNKTNINSPSFQMIRKDYGKAWAITFVRNPDELTQINDLNALFSVAKFYPVKHTKFPLLEEETIIKILDYVDSFKYDSTQTKHRRVPIEVKQKFVDSISLKYKLIWQPDYGA